MIMLKRCSTCLIIWSGNYEILIANVHFAKIVKIFEQSIIRYIGMLYIGVLIFLINCIFAINAL